MVSPIIVAGKMVHVSFFDNSDPLPNCRYNENGVLPTDQKLEREYKLDHNMEVNRQVAKPRLRC
jgi:hypothetical protein